MQAHAWVRNPIGILALFISLIYGMSALLFGTSVSALLPHNQTILTAFIVLFPLLVLGVFAWLVARHHTKLYAPGDFRDDANFLKSVSVAEYGERAKREAVEAATDAARSIDDGTTRGVTAAQTDGPQQVDERDSQTLPPTDDAEDQRLHSALTGEGRAQERMLQSAFLAENLVVRKLEREFGGSVRQGIRLDGNYVDAVIEAGRSIFLVETKFRTTPTPVRFIAMRVFKALEAARTTMLVHSRLDTEVIPILAVVYDVPTLEAVDKSLPSTLEIKQIQIRTFLLSDLKKEFGLK
jgi:hypothetical protein